jgi:hypothetical protein
MMVASINVMDQLRLTWLLLSPSLSSGVMTVVCTIFIVGMSGWLYINHDQLFYDYLFGPRGIQTTLIQITDTSAVLRNWLLGSVATYYILLFVTAVIVGLTVFAILQNAKKVLNGSLFVWQGLHNATQAHKDALKEMFTRLALRIICLLIWAIYLALFITILIPFSTLLVQLGIDRITMRVPELDGLLYIAASIALVLASLHLHVVFARLVRLRPRLFGILDIELAEL